MTYRNGFMRIGTAASQALSTSTISPITGIYGRASLRLRLLHHRRSLRLPLRNEPHPFELPSCRRTPTPPHCVHHVMTLFSGLGVSSDMTAPSRWHDEGRFREPTTAPPSARASSFARRRPRRPKACGGCALKASDCKDAGPQRSGIRMDVSDRCAPGKMRSRASTSLAS
jgi:hypothetical protein